jgi:RNase P/RNase MRP subunit POP5
MAATVYSLGTLFVSGICVQIPCIKEIMMMMMMMMMIIIIIIIIIIIGATGTISKSFRKYVSNVPGKHEVKEL